MPSKVLSDDLDNCLINFDRKVLVTNLLDEYGGLLEEIARTVNEFLSAEEAKGKKFQKTFLLRGLQSDSEDEVITIVPEEKLKQREKQLRDVKSLLYSAETAGGSNSPPTEFVPLKHLAIKLDSLEVREAAAPVLNGTNSTTLQVKEEKPPAKKTGALGAMFKKQETKETTAATKKSPEQNTMKKPEPEKKTGALGAMFKKQDAAAVKKAAQPEAEKKCNTLGSMFKKQESTSTAIKKSPEKTIKSTPDKNKKTAPASKKVAPKSSVLRPPTPKKVNEFFKKDDVKKPKEEPDPNVSVNLFEESASSSDDEETVDALRRQVLSDDDKDKPSTSNKRRRIIDSDEEDIGPDVKVERKDVEPETEEVMEIEDDTPNVSQTFMDDDGFIVTVKAKNRKPTPKPVKIKKSPPKKEVASKTPVAKKKQGNIMSFFTKK